MATGTDRTAEISCSFTPNSGKPEPRLELREVVREVDGITEWHALGVQLGIPKGQLNKIKYKHATDRNLSEIMLELIDSWLSDDPNASWAVLGQALVRTSDADSHEVGLSIFHKYCPELLTQFQTHTEYDGPQTHTKFNVSSMDMSLIDYESLLPRDGSRDVPNLDQPWHGMPPDGDQFSYDEYTHIRHEDLGIQQTILDQQQRRHTTEAGDRRRLENIKGHTHTSSLQRNQLVTGERPFNVRPLPLHNGRHQPLASELPGSFGHGPISPPRSYPRILPPGYFKMSSSMQVSGMMVPNRESMGSNGGGMGPHGGGMVSNGGGMVSNGDGMGSHGGMVSRRPGDPSLASQQHKREQIIKKEQTQLRSQFATLIRETIGIFKKEKISLDELKLHIELMDLPDMNDGRIFGAEELRSLQEADSIDKLFGILKNFMSYESYDLLEALAAAFVYNIDNPSVIAYKQKIDNYKRRSSEFFSWCESGSYADCYEAPQPATLGANYVGIHLNEKWEGRPVRDIWMLQQRELQTFAPRAPYSTTTFQRRSIFVVWRTTSATVEVLQKDCHTRYSHLKGQGVLQLMLGSLELDFISSREHPVIYNIDSTVQDYNDKSDTISMRSGISAMTHCSDETQISSDTGYYSELRESPSILSSRNSIDFSLSSMMMDSDRDSNRSPVPSSLPLSNLTINIGSDDIGSDDVGIDDDHTPTNARSTTWEESTTPTQDATPTNESSKLLYSYSSLPDDGIDEDIDGEPERRDLKTRVKRMFSRKKKYHSDLATIDSEGTYHSASASLSSHESTSLKSRIFPWRKTRRSSDVTSYTSDTLIYDSLPVQPTVMLKETREHTSDSQAI